MGYKTFSRDEYLNWCKKKHIKKPLSEDTRNPFTESGYPILRHISSVVDECDADEWYKNHW